VATGAGIGVFAAYTCAFGGNIVPLQMERRRPIDIRLSYHTDSGHIRRGRRIIGRPAETFNPARFPWLNHEFIDPSGFKAV
jgi:hypothetical protein